MSVKWQKALLYQLLHYIMSLQNCMTYNMKPEQNK